MHNETEKQIAAAKAIADYFTVDELRSIVSYECMCNTKAADLFVLACAEKIKES